MEKRYQATEVRATRAPGGKMRIGGYAARYGVLSGDLGGFRERIAPGAFKRILGTDPDTVCLFNHNNDAVLGRTSAGTLRLSEDSHGLKFECDLPDTTAGRDTYESVQRGDLAGCSFAFQLGDRMDHFDEEEFEEDEEGIRGKVKRMVKRIVRTIRDFASLIDVSVVTHPAYPKTFVDARDQLVAAEVRSRVENFKMTFDEMRRQPSRQSQEWRNRCAEHGVTNFVSFEDVKELHELRTSRRRRLNDLLNQIL
jgi:hypothetical protein